MGTEISVKFYYQKSILLDKTILNIVFHYFDKDFCEKII